jgi:uncharacterized protein YodC (DUF2158 family)
MEFKSGDLVRLKSGGAVMTVHRVVDIKYAEATGREFGIHCDWHDTLHQHQIAWFDEEQLERVSI